MNSFMERLAAYGVDVPETMERFVDDQELYETCFNILLRDKNFADLGKAIQEGRFDDAYGHAHSLKGVTGNLGLTPLYNTICTLVNSLNAKEIQDVDLQFKAVMADLAAVAALA